MRTSDVGKYEVSSQQKALAGQLGINLPEENKKFLSPSLPVKEGKRISIASFQSANTPTSDLKAHIAGMLLRDFRASQAQVSQRSPRQEFLSNG